MQKDIRKFLTPAGQEQLKQHFNSVEFSMIVLFFFFFVITISAFIKKQLLLGIVMLVITGLIFLVVIAIAFRLYHKHKEEKAQKAIERARVEILNTARQVRRSQKTQRRLQSKKNKLREKAKKYGNQACHYVVDWLNRSDLQSAESFLNLLQSYHHEFSQLEQIGVNKDAAVVCLHKGDVEAFYRLVEQDNYAIHCSKLRAQALSLGLSPEEVDFLLEQRKRGEHRLLNIMERKAEINRRQSEVQRFEIRVDAIPRHLRAHSPRLLQEVKRNVEASTREYRQAIYDLEAELRRIVPKK